MAKLPAAIVAAALCASAAAVEYDAVRSGNWSDPATWRGAPAGGPGPGEYARIYPGPDVTVTYDQGAFENQWGFVFGDRCTLVLEKDIHVTTHARVGGYGGGSKLNCNGHDVYSGDFLTAGIYVYGGGTPNSTLFGNGRIYVTNYVTVGGGGSRVEINGGTCRSVWIGRWGNGASNVLRVVQQPRQLDGLTVGTGALTFDTDAINTIDLRFDSVRRSGVDWAMRWQGEHTAELGALAAAGKITWSAPPWMRISIWHDPPSGYTYIGDQVGSAGSLLIVR